MKRSSSSIRAAIAVTPITSAPPPSRRARRLPTTKPASRSIAVARSAAVCRARTGSTASSAGRKVIDRTQAATAPAAAMLPRSWNGGASEKFRLRKPIAVVRLVRKTGGMLMRRLSTIASCLLRPCRISWNMLTRTWTLSAIAMVSTMVGAVADGGVSRMPAQPAKPIVAAADRMVTASVATVPVAERRKPISATTMIPNISGIRSCMSAFDAREKA